MVCAEAEAKEMQVCIVIGTIAVLGNLKMQKVHFHEKRNSSYCPLAELQKSTKEGVLRKMLQSFLGVFCCCWFFLVFL